MPRHLIRSHEYKTVTDEDGNHIPGGAERDVPWVAIAPVVNAIRILEQIVPDGGLLFGEAHHRFGRPVDASGSMSARSVGKRIESFVEWANAEATRHGVPGEVIPPDPHGPIGTARFRRTLAWHIARRPGGLVALAIQYGHMRTALDTDTAGGYGSRSRRGIHDLIAVETALTTAETAVDLRERFQSGEGISGPAARQALTTAATAAQFAGRLIDDPHRFAKRFLARDGEVLYDNPHALLLCLYRRDRALCARGTATDAPTLDRCVPGCGNTVRTDTHVDRLRIRADHIDTQATHVPGPMAERLHANANRLRRWADDHDCTRFTHQETDA
ncbi:hypothetical protein [Streptomyces sp. NPDC001978]|uniref:hypothetical protein n=1 Tax=Streptomyces sp. NPDC001978 TaxID=3364627 RepID=UPI00369F74A5